MAYDILTGMLTSDGWNDTDRRPKNWREMILYLYPNGSAPLTAMLATISGKEASTDPQFHWWTETLADQRLALDATHPLYSNEGLTTVYNPATEAACAAEGDTLYLKLGTNDTNDYKQFRPGHICTMVDATYPQRTWSARVDAVSSTKLTITMLEAGTWSGTADYLEAVDVVFISGNVNEEGAGIPDAITYEPKKFYNYTQIFRTPFTITGTALETQLRTGELKKTEKNKHLEMHSIEIEKALLFGVRTERVGANGRKERTTAGLTKFPNAAGTDQITKTAFSGTWMGTGSANGYYWLMSQLEVLFRYGADSKIALCGNGALLGLTTAAAGNADIQINPMSTKVGSRLVEMITPFGQLYLKTHPLFNLEATLRKCMFCIDPKNLDYRYLRNRDTKFLPNRQNNDVDGEAYEFLTEAGLEVHHPETFLMLYNVG